MFANPYQTLRWDRVYGSSSHFVIFSHCSQRSSRIPSIDLISYSSDQFRCGMMQGFGREIRPTCDLSIFHFERLWSSSSSRQGGPWYPCYSSSPSVKTLHTARVIWHRNRRGILLTTNKKKQIVRSCIRCSFER